MLAKREGVFSAWLDADKATDGQNLLFSNAALRKQVMSGTCVHAPCLEAESGA